jgi:threonine dehydrogenase-like Zn-dependent dehydrogenase
VRGVRGVRQAAFERAIQLIEEGSVPLEKLNTHAFDVADAERAVRTLAGDYPDEHPIHVAIVPATSPGSKNDLLPRRPDSGPW